MDTQRDTTALQEGLGAPFSNSEIRWRPGATSGNRALAIPYVTVRVVLDRLDEVMGIGDWVDAYEVLSDGTVKCRLSLRLNGEWLSKEDVGAPSEQPDEGDRKKAAVSDALKRAAVKWGIARYLGGMPPTWVDYDPQKKQLLKTPAQPAPRPTITPAVQAANRIRGSQLAVNGV